MTNYPKIIHHGAVNGVTGSCHELRIDEKTGILIDCGLFQGTEASPNGYGSERLKIEFSMDHIKVLVVTHVHIDHVGRIPYLLAAGFRGPIYCSEPSALLLPLVLKDAVKIGFTRNQRLINRFLDRLQQQIVPIPYGQWHEIKNQTAASLAIKLKPAGHILGSAYVECRTKQNGKMNKVIFSGDLGAPYTPLLHAPCEPYRADTVVLESTYGDRCHEDRRERRKRLKKVIERSLEDRGVILIPAFSIGRTQELLYELEDLIHHYRHKEVTSGLPWNDLEIIIDSPLASRFTDVYRQLKPFWDKEARQRIKSGRHPLSFEQLTTIDSHEDHKYTVTYLKKTARPCIVIAASGMCSGGRIVNYLKALIEDPRNDILFIGYQARGTPGRTIQNNAPCHGYVELNGKRYNIRARVHTVSGYSAHADQENLVNFIKRMRCLPDQVRLVHGDLEAKKALKRALRKIGLRNNIIALN